MSKFKIISIGKVCNKTYVDAKDEKEARKEFELGNGYGYEEIDSVEKIDE